MIYAIKRKTISQATTYLTSTISTRDTG